MLRNVGAFRDVTSGKKEFLDGGFGREGSGGFGDLKNTIKPCIVLKKPYFQAKLKYL
jgi:hypothetical protein